MTVVMEDNPAVGSLILEISRWKDVEGESSRMEGEGGRGEEIGRREEVTSTNGR
jgi:hypothetical protein